jgi:hypothetical protein
MKAGKKHILIERYSIAILILVMFNRRKIVLHKVGMVDYFPNHNITKTIWERVGIKLYGDGHVINTPNYSNDFEKESQVVWDTHKESLLYLEKFSQYFKNKRLGSYLVKLMESEKILIAVQKSILERISEKILLLKVYEHYKQSSTPMDGIIFDNYDRFFFEQYVRPNKVQTLFYKTTSIINLFKSIVFSIVYVIFSPRMGREIIRRGLRIKKIIKNEYDVGIHMTWGFSTKQIIKEENMHKRSDDFNDALLINKGMVDANKTAFVYSRWNFSQKNRKLFDKIVKEMGSVYIDEINNKISINALLMYLKNYISLIFVYFSSLFRGEYYPLWFMHNMHKIINDYFMHIVFCDYYSVKVFVSRDDYDSQHITRTICQNKYGLKNVGIQHSAFCDYYKIPQSAHLYFDTYYTMGEGYQKLWSPYWDNNKSLVHAGTHRDFSVIEAYKNNTIRERFKKKYNGRITILMLISKHDESNSPFWLLDQKYKNLDSVLKLDNRLHLILRPRTIEAIDTIFKICPKLHDYVKKGRCSVELDDFTTQELMPFVDVLVSEDSSSSLLESLIVNDLFSIFFMVRYGYFSHITDMVVHDSTELSDMIYSFLNHDVKYEAANKQRDYIRRKFVTQPMGHTWERIGLDINKTLSLWN